MPSNSTVTSLLFAAESIRKLLRYQPTPPGAKPVPLAYSRPSGPSMLQSCGRFNVRQLESSNAGIMPAGKSPLLNFQLRSKSTTVLDSGAGEIKSVAVCADTE